MRVLVTTDNLQPGDDIDQLLRGHGHEAIHRPAAGPRRTDEALSLFDGIHGAIMASEPETDEMLDSAAHLKVIARSGVGDDSIDIDAATARGIAVGDTPGANHHAIAGMASALVLMAARQLHKSGQGSAAEIGDPLFGRSRRVRITSGITRSMPTLAHRLSVTSRTDCVACADLCVNVMCNMLRKTGFRGLHVTDDPVMASADSVGTHGLGEPLVVLGPPPDLDNDLEVDPPTGRRTLKLAHFFTTRVLAFSG